MATDTRLTLVLFSLVFALFSDPSAVAAPETQSFDASAPTAAAVVMTKDLEFISAPRTPGDSGHDETHPQLEPEEGGFGYGNESGDGPEKWGQLKPEWEACGKGNKQSPIDISNDHVSVSAEMGPLHKKYRPAHSHLRSSGHDIQISWNGDAGEIRINGTEYHLKACHWHSPSEHTINGTRYDLELHMVHESDQGQKSVVAILYRFGQHDEFLAMFMHAITTLGTSDEVIGFTNPSDIKFGTKKYYRYEGSLTTPPCTEGVIWNVIKKVRTASKSQIFALRGAVNKGFEKNSRPTQPLNGRTVRLYSPPDTQ